MKVGEPLRASSAKMLRQAEYFRDWLSIDDVDDE